MIDEKKIEAAAKHYAEENSMSIEDQMGDMYDGIEELSDAYKAGANWAINEFLKDLLHPADEEPNKGKFILMEMRNGDNYAPYWVNDEYSWERICTMFTTTSWLYIDDLFPKKGGYHD